MKDIEKKNKAIIEDDTASKPNLLVIGALVLAAVVVSAVLVRLFWKSKKT